jgi:hypothetical protein
MTNKIHTDQIKSSKVDSRRTKFHTGICVILATDICHNCQNSSPTEHEDDIQPYDTLA